MTEYEYYQFCGNLKKIQEIAEKKLGKSFAYFRGIEDCDGMIKVNFEIPCGCGCGGEYEGVYIHASELAENTQEEK